MKMYLEKKYRQIKNLFNFIPIIWNLDNSDYYSSITVFKHQLKNILSHLESNKSLTSDSKHYASRIKTAIRLIEKVYDEEYSDECIEKIIEKYGKREFVLVNDSNSNLSTIEIVRENNYSLEELKLIQMDEELMYLESFMKQEKAERILWKFISHNIKNWWF